MPGLNSEQAAAARALSGKVLIGAGAGSGKTRTLVARFVSALDPAEAEGWPAAVPEEILAITFTEKAAGELAERVRTALFEADRPADARALDGAWIGTIHSFCARTLRRYALEAGIDPSFSVADTVEAQRLREAAFERACVRLREGGDIRLLADFEFDGVYAAASALSNQLRTRGLSASDLKVEPAEPIGELLGEAIGVLRAGRDAAAACGDTRAQATRLFEGCRDTAAELAELLGQGLDDDEIALRAWRALSAFKPSGTAASIRDTAAEVKEVRAGLLPRMVAAAMVRHARELVDLTGLFEEEYGAAKRRWGVLDFDDLQIETLHLFEARADVLERMRGRFRLTMVDEFQDTDALQLALVEGVSAGNLCTVGDEQQSIYGFRGADVDVYRRHNEAMRRAGAREFELEHNYRSHPEILGFVNGAFEELFGDRLIRLEAGREEGAPYMPDDVARVRVTFVRTSGRGGTADGRSAEAADLAERLRELRDDFGADPGDMVILLRSYRHADRYAAELAERGFNVAVVGGNRFLGSSAVLTARALLRVVANPYDDQALASLLASPAGLSPAGLWALGTGRSRESGPLWEACGDETKDLGEHDRVRLSRLRLTVERARARSGVSGLSEVLLRAVEDLDYDLFLLSRGPLGRIEFGNLLKLAAMAEGFERSSGSGPAAFVEHLDAKERYGEHVVPAAVADEHGSAVRIMSIHASKGLEFPVVAVPELGSSLRSDSAIARWDVGGEDVRVGMRLPAQPGCTAESGADRSGLFARIHEKRAGEQRAEAQRLLYVACTRAREVLLLSGAGSLSKPADPGAASPIEWVRAVVGGEPAGDPERRVLGGGAVEVRTIESDMPAPAAVDGSGSAVPDLVAVRAEDAAGAGNGERGGGEAGRPGNPDAAELAAGIALERMSYSDFGLLEDCPRRFWASRILRVGTVRVPGGPDPLSFGNAVHAVLERAGEGPAPPEPLVEAIARSFELEPARFAEVRQAVEAFARSRVAGRLADIGTTLREWPFTIQVGHSASPFVLVGTMDAYARRGDEALIVDYKTGTSGRGDELVERYALQASIYAYAALREGCGSVEIVFARLQDLDERGMPREIAYAFTAADAERIEADLIARYGEAIGGAYPSLAAEDAHLCGDCPIAGGLCDVPRRRS